MSEETTTKTLTELELANIEAHGYKKAITDLRKKDMSQQRQIVSLQQRIQNLELILKEKNLMQELGKLEQKGKKEKEERKEFLESIREKYDLEGDWGYNSEGEIVNGDEEE